MRRYTTPTITVNITGVDLTGYHTFTTLKQGNKVITLEDLPVSPTDGGCTLTGKLTQEQTANFDPYNDIQIQVRFITPDGVASASNIKSVTVKNVLMEGVINYE